MQLDQFGADHGDIHLAPQEVHVLLGLHPEAQGQGQAAGLAVTFDLLGDFLAQVIWIGLAEEVFNRGYLMQRLCDWLGDRRGLVLSSLLFGLSHVASRLSQHGSEYLVRDLLVGLQTLIGGLVLGFMYLRAKNIVPPAIFHVSANLYLERIMACLGW